MVATYFRLRKMIKHLCSGMVGSVAVCGVYSPSINRLNQNLNAPKLREADVQAPKKSSILLKC